MDKKNLKQSVAEHTLWYEKPAKNFNEALPLGNGRIGVCMYGRLEEETVSLNEDTLWSGYPKEPEREDYQEVYQKARILCDQGKFSEAQELLENKFGDHLVQMYLPLGRLKILNRYQGEINHYRRALCIDEAVHRVSFCCAGKNYLRESFVSFDAQALIMHMTCSEPGNISFAAWLESDLKSNVYEKEGRIWLSGHAPDCISEYGTGYPSTECQVYSVQPSEQGMGFAAVLSVKARGGTVKANREQIMVTEADEVTLYITVRTGFAGWNIHPAAAQIPYKKNCLADMKKAEQRSYQELRETHLKAYKELYDRCKISLRYSKNSFMPTDRRLRLHEDGQEDLALYTLLFNYGKYLAIASSREGTQPSNLQGIWNEKLLPPWNSNYTLNINTEMNYWPILSMGLYECYEPLIKMTEELAESGRRTAQLYYGIDGWVCHHSSDLWRLTHPGTNRIKKNAQWGFWNMASGWLGVMMWKYYLYTGDMVYLKRIYPIMEEAARFYRKLLTERAGWLVLSPATSPENNYIEYGEICALDYSTAMTQEILYELFLVVSKTQEILGIEDTYKELLPRLKRPCLQKNGLLCEWDVEHEVWDVHHRHVSHLYGLFPGDQFDDVQKEGAKKTLQQRGDGGTGWSLAWKINLWARLRDGEHALKLLDNQLKLVPGECDTPELSGGSYLNLLCAHPPFQIDGNFGAANGIIQMLVQTDENDDPVLLPALPKSWSEGSVEGICLPGGRKINFSWKEGKIIHVEV